MKRRSLGAVSEPDARTQLDQYTDLAKAYAFATYDRRPRVDTELDVEDIMMANILNLGMLGKWVTPLFAAGEGAPQALLAALRHADRELAGAKPYEDHASVQDLEATVAPLSAANLAAETVSRWTAVAVSKVLHRRRPHIVPLIDSRVYEFYGTTKPSVVRAALWEDLQVHGDRLRELAGGYRTLDGDRLTLLRLADILIWTP